MIVGPNWYLHRKRLADCGIGFGKDAIGGRNGRFYIVTDSSDNDPAWHLATCCYPERTTLDYFQSKYVDKVKAGTHNEQL